MSRFSAQAARIAVDMRNQSLFMIFGLTAEILCAASAAANDSEQRNRDRSAWHLSIVSGGEPPPRSSLRPPIADPHVRPASTEAAPPPEVDLEAGSWSLQLGMVPPPQAHRTQFGPADGIPVAGDFNGDGFDEIGMFLDGRWFIDLNGNGRWDRDDLWAKLGEAGDLPVVGDWDRDGKADIGVMTGGGATLYRTEAGLAHPRNAGRGAYRNVGFDPADVAEALLRTDRRGLQARRVTHVFEFGREGDVPVVGDWQGLGAPSIGVFRDGVWLLDTDGDGRFTEADETVRLGRAGDRPIVGDFNRDGTDELGIYRDGLWHLDTSGDRRLGDDDLRLQLGDDDDTPVVGDWDGDGRDQVGVVHRDAGRS